MEIALKNLGIMIPEGTDPMTLFTEFPLLPEGWPESQKKKIDSVMKIFNEIVTRRMNKEAVTIKNHKDVYNTFKKRGLMIQHEEVHVLLLDSANKVIDCVKVCTGDLSQVTMSQMQIAKIALHYNAKGVILIHNHPSGTALPGKADMESTDKLKKALQILQILLIDHVIIGNGEYFSFAEEELYKK